MAHGPHKTQQQQPKKKKKAFNNCYPLVCQSRPTSQHVHHTPGHNLLHHISIISCKMEKEGKKWWNLWLSKSNLDPSIINTQLTTQICKNTATYCSQESQTHHSHLNKDFLPIFSFWYIDHHDSIAFDLLVGSFFFFLDWIEEWKSIISWVGWWL